MFKALKEKRKKGFTLIELIVVIAVLGILVLLAAPRFLGYTADANVAAMQADAKVLSNAALVYNIENEVSTAEGVDSSGYPVDSTGTPIEIDEIGVEGYEINPDLVDIKNLKNDYSDYILVIEGDNEGEVYHKTGVDNKEGETIYGVE